MEGASQRYGGFGGTAGGWKDARKCVGVGEDCKREGEDMGTERGCKRRRERMGVQGVFSGTGIGGLRQRYV